VLIRRNPLVIFMSIELMLNAANLALVAFGQRHGTTEGQALVFFVMCVAAAEVAVGPRDHRGDLPPAPAPLGRRAEHPARLRPPTNVRVAQWLGEAQPWPGEGEPQASRAHTEDRAERIPEKKYKEVDG